MYYKKLLLTIGWLILASTSNAQDTLRINLAQTDSLFIHNNLMLMSKALHINAAKALIKQAKLWDNPSVTAEFNLYNANKDKYFDAGRNGEKIFTVDQLIVLAGKRNKRIALAKANATYTEFEFYDLMRTLKLEIRNNFYTIYYNNNTVEKYNEQLKFLSTIIDALEFQSAKGNISLKEVLRLKAEYYQLNNDRTELINQIFDAQENLKTLLNTTAYLKPIVLEENLQNYNTVKINDNAKLINQALNNRSDLKMVESLAKQNELNYQLQKRLSIPDLHLGAIYDQAGSYINNYTGVTLGIDLPVLNRNQGNIKYAKAMADASMLELKNKNLAITNEVLAAIHKLEQVEQEFKKVDQSFGANFKLINDGFVANYQKRNISLIEFIDFFDAYNQSILQLNRLNEKRIRTYEELNYITGEELFK